MLMHWDGNISVPLERNVISALALIGPRVEYLDFPRVERIADFAEELMPPRYADRIPGHLPGIRHELLESGERIFRERCATCHAQDGDRTERISGNCGTSRPSRVTSTCSWMESGCGPPTYTTVRCPLCVIC
jgi:hypothetical protein